MFLLAAGMKETEMIGTWGMNWIISKDGITILFNVLPWWEYIGSDGKRYICQGIMVREKD